MITENKKLSLPPFTMETALQKVQMAEDAWNTKDPEKICLAYTIETEWRNGTDFINWREEVKEFLKKKWEKELDCETLTALISERIIIEAKSELYLTSKTVKEIAFDLGYEDEHYFSRFFKVNADISPQIFRETVGFARAEA